MDINSLPSEVIFWLAAIAIVTITGCVSGLHGWIRISDEKKRVKRAESFLISDAAWDDAYPHDKLGLDTWLRTKGIKSDSHLGDFIRTSWSAWLGGRPASLTELHMLVARRERKYKLTRLSAGISALLLVFGIVGTLFSIKPVLANFKFQVAQDSSSLVAGMNDQDSGQDEVEKDAASVEANTELVNTLIHNLGNAFWPSLAALLGTILVVSCRGMYSSSLHDFTLELDRFAVDTLIPRYRVPSLSEQYQEVKVTLASVATNLLQREGRFHEVVGKLENLVAGISPALTGLEAAAAANKAASESLTSEASSITEGLIKHFGEKSPLHQALLSFEDNLEKTEESLSNLSSVVIDIGKANAGNQQKLKSSLEVLSLAIDKISGDHKKNQTDAIESLGDLKRELSNVPGLIADASSSSTSQAMHLVTSNLANLATEQRKWHIDSANELKKVTEEGLAGVIKLEKDLLTTTSQFKEMKNEATVAIANVATTAKIEITSATATASSDISKLNEKLNQTFDRMGYPKNDSPLNSGFSPDSSPRDYTTTSQVGPYGNANPDPMVPEIQPVGQTELNSNINRSELALPVLTQDPTQDQLDSVDNEPQNISQKPTFNYGKSTPLAPSNLTPKKKPFWGIFSGKKD